MRAFWLIVLALASFAPAVRAADTVPASILFSRMASYRLEFSVSQQGGENGVRRLVGSADRTLWPKLQGIRTDCLREVKVSMVYDLSGTYAADAADRDLEKLSINPFTSADVLEGAQRLLTCAALALDDPKVGIIINRQAYWYPRVLINGPGRQPVTPNLAKWRNWLETEGRLAR